jgi:HEPN domain-containing protein
MRPDTLSWWRQAEADLASGDIMLVNGQWYAASWFAQQGTENAMRALNVEQVSQRAVPDFEQLGQPQTAPHAVRADLKLLSRSFEESQYPDLNGVPPVDRVTTSEAQYHLEACRRVLAWVRPQL